MAMVATIIVNETAGLRRFAYPLHTILTLPHGRAHRLEMLYFQDISGAAIPVQMHAEDTWQDGSMRLVSIHFSCSMGPLEQKLYRLVAHDSPVEGPAAVDLIDWRTDEHRLSATIRRFVPALDRHGAGLFQSVLDGGKEFMAEGSAGLGIVTASGDRFLASEHVAPVDLLQAGPLAGHMRWQGIYPVGDRSSVMPYSIQMRFTLFKSWVEITHTLRAPAGVIEEVFAHIRLRVCAAPLLYDIGVGGGTYGKIEPGERVVYRAEVEPFQTRWTLSTVTRSAARADVVGVRASQEPMQREWLHWIDREKSLALVTESSWHSRGMTYEIDSTGDLSVRFFPALEDYPMTLQFKFWYHFLDTVPHIGAATSPQSIMWPPVITYVTAE
jgi:hypothetical protein